MEAFTSSGSCCTQKTKQQGNHGHWAGWCTFSVLMWTAQWPVSSSRAPSPPWSWSSARSPRSAGQREVQWRESPVVSDFLCRSSWRLANHFPELCCTYNASHSDGFPPFFPSWRLYPKQDSPQPPLSSTQWIFTFPLKSDSQKSQMNTTSILNYF